MSVIVVIFYFYDCYFVSRVEVLLSSHGLNFLQRSHDVSADWYEG